jgi:hypothetical protein
MGIALGCGIVGRFVDLVEKAGGVALVLVNGGFVPRSVGVVLCRWWVVESYISGLLL